MCGICGIISFDQKRVPEASIRNMMAIQKHRGPDDDGIFIEDNVGFGFVRLSILDLTLAGHQPMFSSDEQYVVVYNGEIFNYIELQAELKSFGHQFRTNTDTEVLLAAYQQWGEDCLNRFNGMWAFVIYDREDKKIFASRDRYGIKPFYYYLNDRFFAFASEIPSLLSLLPDKPTQDNQSIFDYLVFNRTDQTERTFFNEIKKLQHGHNINIDLQNSQYSNFSIKKWYDLKNRVRKCTGFSSPEEFRKLFSSAVGLRLRSDVPVGVCLSGGLDSTSIVSILLNDFQKKDLNTFSAVYNPGQHGDESALIDLYRPKLKNMHFVKPSSQSLINDIQEFIRAHAEPIPSTSPYAQFKVMELAKDNVVVTLDGQGADEGLAGYHYFFGYFFVDLLKHMRIFKLSKEICNYLVNHRSLYGIITFLYFLLPEKMRLSMRVNQKGYLKREFATAFLGQNIIAGNLYNAVSLQDALLNHFEYKIEHLLKWEDRNSMWFSLEARVPFLDYRLVEKILATQSDKIIHKGVTKHILRESMKGLLPEKIRMCMKKIGFGTPQDEWFKTEEWKTFIFGIIKSKSFSQRDLIDPDLAVRRYRQYLDGKIEISQDIWKWIHLELWFREFID